MTERKLDSGRLYKVVKMLVLAITAIAIIVTLDTGYQAGFGTDNLLHKWEKYCAQNPDDPELTGISCMLIGLEEVHQVNDTFFKAFLVTILLPTIFFGGTAFYKYLFPVKTKQ
jgi:hypothetical protein